METCPDFVDVDNFFKRTSSSYWEDYDLYFSTASQPSHGSFMRDLQKIADNEHLSYFLRKRATSTRIRVNEPRRKNSFLALQDAFHYRQQQMQLRVNSSLKVEHTANSTVLLHKKSTKSREETNGDTANATFADADASVSGYRTAERRNSLPKEKNSLYGTSPANIYNLPQRNPFINECSQGSKHGRDTEADEEYNANQTVIGGKNIDWIRIRDRLTRYQLKKNPPKTKPEYYDVLFFNINDKNGFLGTLEESTVAQMLKDIKKEEKTKDNTEQDIKLLLDSIIDYDIKKTKERLKRRKEDKDIDSFEKKFALHFVSLMIEQMEDVDSFLDHMSENTYIVDVLAPALHDFFIKNKKNWRVSYGDTCLKASAKDDERRSSGEKIDMIVTLREEDEEFSVTVVSGSPTEKNWNHFKGDRMKIMKMLKSLMNRFAELRPGSDIRLVRLYGLQSYLHELIIYEFQLKYTELYTMEGILKFPLPKRWKDMLKAHETVMGLLKYENLLFESSKTIREFLRVKGSNVEAVKRTTRVYTSPEYNMKKTKKARTY
ncbi:12853_t:CDS:2 [Ambispora gerdemannii]|uniref:12853_t:CDS:1 n=1 Tax=Ambispora gerdemannii TaxID=144530 RepID=A0A9N8Z8F6_9GLOM|nr:12853_t:CDS:2 [Ambispora gerdemannii]